MAAEKRKIKIKNTGRYNVQYWKTYGKGAIMKLGDGVVNKIEAISTGSVSLDYALGIGGVPRGRIVEIYGPESSGKTTVCLHTIAEAQKMAELRLL